MGDSGALVVNRSLQGQDHQSEVDKQVYETKLSNEDLFPMNLSIIVKIPINTRREFYTLHCPELAERDQDLVCGRLGALVDDRLL